MKRVIPLRAYLIGETLMRTYIAFHAPEERLYALRSIGGVGVAAGMLAMSALSLVALLDIFLTGTKRPLFAFLASHREFVWIAMAVGYALQAWVAIAYGFSPAVAVMYVLSVLGCASVAVLDHHYKFKAQCQHLRDTGHGPL